VRVFVWQIYNNAWWQALGCDILDLFQRKKEGLLGCAFLAPCMTDSHDLRS